MRNLIDGLQKWLRRNKTEEGKVTGDPRKREGNWFTRRDGRGSEKEKRKPCCIFCKGEHWNDQCKSIVTLDHRNSLFRTSFASTVTLGYRGSECRSRGCFYCGARHHTSLCTKDGIGSRDTSKENGPVLTGYTPVTEEPTLPAVVPVRLNGEVLRAFLDTGSGRNFISREAAVKLKLRPARHELKEIITVNSSTKQSMPIFEVAIESVDGKTQEDIELTGSNFHDFTTIRRPDMNQLKHEFEHTKDKRFYMNPEGSYLIHMILGDKTYCKLRTEEVFKGNPGDPVEGSTFDWIVHGACSREKRAITRDCTT